MSEEAKVGLGLYAEGYHAGLEKAKADMRSFEGQSNRSLGNTQNSWNSLGRSLDLSNGRLKTYIGGVTGIAGQFEVAGIKAGGLGRAISLLSTMMSGSLGPGSIAVAGLVGIVALISKAKDEQKKLREETEKATKALIDQAVLGLGITMGSGEDLARQYAEDRKKQAEYEAEINKLEKERKNLGVFEKGRYEGITRELGQWRQKLWDVNKELGLLDKALERARQGSRQNPIEIDVVINAKADRPGKAAGGKGGGKSG